MITDTASTKKGAYEASQTRPTKPLVNIVANWAIRGEASAPITPPEHLSSAGQVAGFGPGGPISESTTMLVSTPPLAELPAKLDDAADKTLAQRAALAQPRTPTLSIDLELPELARARVDERLAGQRLREMAEPLEVVIRFE